jgi:hypothetical protein
LGSWVGGVQEIKKNHAPSRPRGMRCSLEAVRVLKFRKVPAESLSLSADIELGSLLVSREGAAHKERRQKRKGGVVRARGGSGKGRTDQRGMLTSKHGGMHVFAHVQTRIVSSISCRALRRRCCEGVGLRIMRSWRAHPCTRTWPLLMRSRPTFVGVLPPTPAAGAVRMGGPGAQSKKSPAF